MKKEKQVFTLIMLLVLFALTLTSCSVSTASGDSSTNSTTTTISDNPTPDPTILIYGNVYPIFPSLSSNVDCFAIVSIMNVNGTLDSSFNTAQIKVNNVLLDRSSIYAGFDGYFSGIVKLSTGDTVQYEIKHPRIGTIKGSLTVPASLTDFTVSGIFPAKGVANTRSDYVLNWIPVSGVNKYCATMYAYDSSKNFITGISQIANFQTFTPDSKYYKDSSNNFYPYIELAVYSYNDVPIPGFSSNSTFSAKGTYSKVYTNK